jgi:hypothetical protein
MVSQLNQMLDKFDELLKEYLPETVVIESVELWGASAKSLMTGYTGDLMKLSYLVGGYLSICNDMKIPVLLISAKRWKGQMRNDRQLVQRVKLANGQTYESEHVRCAVGIGLSILGVL